MEKRFQERIDEYILGKMSDEDHALFKAEVNQDEAKQQQLKFTMNVKDAIVSREDKLAKLKMMQVMYDNKHPKITAPESVGKRLSRRFWWWMTGVAAVFITGLFLINMLTPIALSPTEILRGDDDEVYDAEIPEIKDSIAYDTLYRDTIMIVNEASREIYE